MRFEKPHFRSLLSVLAIMVIAASMSACTSGSSNSHPSPASTASLGPIQTPYLVSIFRNVYTSPTSYDSAAQSCGSLTQDREVKMCDYIVVARAAASRNGVKYFVNNPKLAKCSNPPGINKNNIVRNDILNLDDCHMAKFVHSMMN